ncbi:putative transposase [Kluyvera intermedia]|nr:putative transposase [Kluyvera intermedia]
MQKGLQTGEQEASRKIARAMLEKGFPTADIIELTGVSAEELPSLQH